MEKINLNIYYQELCSILNQKGFRYKLRSQGKIEELEYEIIDENHPKLTILSFAENRDAFHYLIENGLLKKDTCLFCGNIPVDGKYTFTEPINGIKLNICEDCHTTGKNMQRGTESKSGCLSFVVIFLSIGILFTALLTI